MATPEKPDLESGTSVGQYTVQRRIGSGGMGEVYEATHVGLSKRVAIKTLRRQYAQNEIVVTRFLREGQLASRIRHPHIVDVTDVGVIDGLPCLVMEYLDGESLHEMFKRERGLEPSRLVDIMLPVIAAVDVAHKQGVVHRDLKPANIYLSRGWNGEITPKVLDFGISKIVEEAAPSELTTDSTFLGSPHYVSPELARGERNLDGRSDQYSIGVILYEGLCGVRPFAGKADTFMSLMYAIAQGDYPPPSAHRPGLPTELERAVLRAMARNRNDRFQTVGALGRALLPFASPRTRMIWEPVFSAAPTTAVHEMTVPDMPRPSLEDSAGGTLAHSAASFTPSMSQSGVLPTPKTRPLGALWWLLASAAALLVGMGVSLGAAKYFTLKKAYDSSAAPQGGVEGVSDSPSTYTVKLRVTPPDAKIEVDGRHVATGSYTGTFTTDARKHSLRITADGYVTQTVEFDGTALPSETITLQEAAPVAPSATAGKKTPRPLHTSTKPPPTATTTEAPPPPPPPTATGPKIKTDNRDPWEDRN
jgi:serine/threonine protein kinase